MRNKVVAIGIALVAVGLGLWLWHGRSDSKAPASSTASAATAPRRAKEPAKPASLAGRVTRKSDGAAIAGANVALAAAGIELGKRDSDTRATVVTSDASGTWHVPSIAPGEYLVTAAAVGYLPVSHDKIAIASGEQRDGVDFALAAGGTLLHGTVSDVTGGPIAGARIYAYPRITMKVMFGEAGIVAISGPDGRYELTLADGGFTVAATHDDYTHAQQQVQLAGKPVVADFVLTPGGVIHGQVIARDTGKPVPGAQVAASAGHRGANGATADEAGKFAIKSLPPGAISLTAAGRGYASAAPTIAEVGIGEQVDGVRVVVDKARSISGRVVKRGHTDQGIAGVLVAAFSLTSGQTGQTEEPSDATGAFEIVGMRPGGYMLFAIGENKVPEIGKPIEVADHDVKDVLVEMATGATLAGRVDPPGAAKLHLALVGDIGIGNMFDLFKVMFVAGETDETGAFALHNVPAGAFELVATTREGPAGKLPVIVADADQKGLVIALESRAAVAGRVIDTKGAPVAGVAVAASAIERPNKAFSFGDDDGVTTGSDGAFRIVGLEAGKYRVHVNDLEDMLERDKDKKDKPPGEIVELAKGAERTGLTLTIDARDGVIRGQVIGGDGKPATDAWVTAHREVSDKLAALGDYDFDGAKPVLAGGDGRFVVDRLRKGSYRLVAVGQRGASRAEKAGAKPGDIVTIALQPLGTLTGHVTARAAAIATYDLTCRGPAGPVDRHVEADDGAYTLEHLAPGSYTCDVSADAGTAHGKVDVSGTATLDLQLVPWASLTGTVVSALTGKPVGQVMAIAQGDSNDTKQMLAALTGDAPTTDASGRFVIERVASGKGHLLLLPKAGGMDKLASRDFTASQGQRTDLGTIKIVPPRTTEAGTFGFATTVDGDALAVSSVAPNGPAARAGLGVGDKITAIDGHPIAEITPDIAQQALSSGVIGIGETVAVQLSNGTTLTLTSIKW